MNLTPEQQRSLDNYIKAIEAYKAVCDEEKVDIMRRANARKAVQDAAFEHFRNFEAAKDFAQYLAKDDFNAQHAEEFKKLVTQKVEDLREQIKNDERALAVLEAEGMNIDADHNKEPARLREMEGVSRRLEANRRTLGVLIESSTKMTGHSVSAHGLFNAMATLVHGICGLATGCVWAIGKALVTFSNLLLAGKFSPEPAGVAMSIAAVGGALIKSAPLFHIKRKNMESYLNDMHYRRFSKPLLDKALDDFVSVMSGKDIKKTTREEMHAAFKNMGRHLGWQNRAVRTVAPDPVTEYQQKQEVPKL